MNEVSKLEGRLEEARRELQRLDSEASAAPRFSAQLAAASFQRHVEDLEQQLHLAKAEGRREVFEWHLRGERVRFGSIPLRLLAKLSEHFNSAVTSGAWRLRNAIDIRVIPADFYDLLDIRLADVRSGSSRVIFTGNTSADMTGESLLGDTLKHTFALLRGDQNAADADPVAALGVRSASAYAEWLKTLQEHGVSAEFTWQDASDVQHEWSALPSDMARVRERLASFSETAPVVERIYGSVIALAETGRVQIRSDAGKLSIRYPRKLYAKIQTLTLGQMAEFEVQHSQLTNAETRRTIHRYALLGVQ